MAGEPRPRLVPVDGDPKPPDGRGGGSATRSGQAPPAAESAPRRSSERHARILLGALAVAALVLGVLFATQAQRAAELREQVQALDAELESSRAVIGAYQDHLEAVRTEVGDLAARMGALQSLVDRDPTADGPGAGRPAGADLEPLGPATSDPAPER